MSRGPESADKRIEVSSLLAIGSGDYSDAGKAVARAGGYFAGWKTGSVNVSQVWREEKVGNT